ncbi:MAG: UDP-glucose/GDP-mannose dehydrogenase family protein [Phycisphaeraceae bacterium]|nr:UDP-glucose/GDP-mannose dehydrogenase family protein [Phycisphaeraceae bacterium]
MRITMVGTGYVGLVTGTCFANTGNDVICLDIDPRKIEKLNRGESPIYEPGLDDLIHRNARAGRLTFTTDKQKAYESAEVVFLCVGTPSDEVGRADLQYVLAAAADLGKAMTLAPGATGGDAEERRRKIIVVKSTVPVGTNTKVRATIAQHTDKPFFMASNPEFLKEGAAINDFMKPDRVVIGVDDESAGGRLSALYEPFVRNGHPIHVMDIASAEMVKYASNAMLATKISFINEIACLCEAYGANIDEVRRGMCADARIGHQFLYPGLGYGGSCFPKDVLACIGMGIEAEHPATLLKAVHEVNQAQRQAFIQKIVAHFEGRLSGRKIAVWGIAFKPGTDDVREAPAVTIMKHLLDAGATVTAHDPVAHETCRQIKGVGDRISYADNMYDTLDGADALIVCTDWDEFKNPNFDVIRQRMAEPVIFDGRNLYKISMMYDERFVYHSVGRASIWPASVKA